MFTDPKSLSKEKLEEGDILAPKFDDKGLIPAIVQDAKSKKILMMAYMNELALQKTIQTGQAHFWSRSRSELWHKGATSGNLQEIVQILMDCDQDCLILEVTQLGKGGACHTGRENCFYRQIDLEKSDKLKFIK